MEVLTSVAPAAHVDPSDLADRAHRPLDARQEQPQLGCELFGKVARVCEVSPREEQEDHRERRRVVASAQPPTLVRPEKAFVGCRTSPAVDAAGTDARLLRGDRRKKLSRTDLALERKGLPLFDRRHAERVLGARVELFWRLRH
jgi:hypothetical protein